MIAALFVMSDGPYAGLPEVDPWDEARDARTYRGPHPVVAHPPCQRWGRYWYGGPRCQPRRKLGDDDGCFESALYTVRYWGGVIEHPEASHAFRWFCLPRPPKGGGWVQETINGQERLFVDDKRAWACCVEQGHYGHPARKATWLYYVSKNPPPELIWGPSTAHRKMDQGYHTKAERDAARAAGNLRPVDWLTKRERAATPPAFRDLLLELARRSR